MGLEEFDEEDVFEFLDELRDSGVTHMIGAGVYIVEGYGVDKATARKLLTKWMQTFSDRHPKGT
jgi:hypothetical protein